MTITAAIVLLVTYGLLMIVWGCAVVYDHVKWGIEDVSWWWLIPVIFGMPYSMWVYRRNCDQFKNEKMWVRNVSHI